MKRMIHPDSLEDINQRQIGPIGPSRLILMSTKGKLDVLDPGVL